MAKKIDTKEALRLARSSLLEFMAAVWWMPHKFCVGRHTVAICDRLTRAAEDWARGKSSYLIIKVPFRHGKSDIVSRAFPAWFLGRYASSHPSLIMSGYGHSLVCGFSDRCKAIISSPRYREVFPGVSLDSEHNKVDDWRIAGSSGSVTVQGLGGAITGRGGNLIILDDFCKSRSEAFSPVIRDKTWQSFSVDLMTRQNPPAAIVVVCATPWHTDDVIGRIYGAMESDPNFPRFETLSFPAQKAESVEGACDGWGTLFPAMYDSSWYARQRASLGAAMSAALLDCSPVGETSRVFREEWWHTTGTPPPREGVNVYIIIDSANGKRASNDFTSMWVVGLGRDGCYYVLDGIHDRLNLGERTEALFSLVEKWRPLYVFWEQVGAMCDVAHVEGEQDRRAWHFPILPLRQSVAKSDRIGWLVPEFERGGVWFPSSIPRSRVSGEIYDCVRDFKEQEFDIFPAAVHDDMIDCLANIRHPEFRRVARFPEEGKAGDFSSSHTVGGDWRPW